VEQTIQLYKALSEEMRLRILMLLTHGELCVCDLMAIFDEPQSKISRHLAYLRNSGLVNSKRVGTWMHYSIKEPLHDVAGAQLDFIRERLSSLGWSKADMAKMEEVKAKKICEAGGTKTASPVPPEGAATRRAEGRKK
jgi:ArsR family transcriptional regulator